MQAIQILFLDRASISLLRLSSKGLILSRLITVNERRSRDGGMSLHSGREVAQSSKRKYRKWAQNELKMSL